MTDTIETRVARGAALLDEQMPGWVDRIDLDRLDLMSTCDCVLGLLFAYHPAVRDNFEDPYDVGTVDLFTKASDVDLASRVHGFDREPNEKWTPLTAEWKRVILARRGGAS